MTEINLVEILDVKPPKCVVGEYTLDLRTNKVPLIIDNGSYQCRVGWSTSEKPDLNFRNLIAKPRKDRRKDCGEMLMCPPVQIGNDIVNIEAMRFQLKTQFDRNVVTHYYNQEQIFDYIFSTLGMDDSETFPHPVVLTEPLGNPNHCRQRKWCEELSKSSFMNCLLVMAELLFECYGIPSVCYCIDSLCSAHHNNIGKHGLVISFGYHTTHVIPLLNGKYILSKARRLSIGGYHIITYLYRLMQMKYPVHLNSITISRMETLLKKHCYVSTDYLSDIRKWADSSFYDENVIKIQLPYTEPTQSNGSNLTAEQKLEKKKELTKRLWEIKTKQRKEKIMRDQDRLNKLQSMKKVYEAGDHDQFQAILKENDIKNLEELEQSIQNIQQSIAQLQEKLSMPRDIETFPKEGRVNLTPHPPENVSFDDWINDVKNKRSEMLERKQTRKIRRQDLAKRRTAAAQERMRLISHLARKDNGCDDFGYRDEDWDIYKTINRDNDTESEAENEKLSEYEDILRRHNSLSDEPVVFGYGVAENHQLHVGVELVRVPELLFQPSMIGSPEAGLAELINYVLKLFDSDEQELLCSRVFMTGGCAKFTGLKERISKELLQMRPTQSKFQVVLAEIPDLDSWLGAKDLTQSENLKKFWTTAHDIEENGYEYFKDHTKSNAYFPTPKAFRIDDDN